MRRRVLAVFVVVMSALCMGANETDEEDTSTSTSDCVKECKASDHQGCEQACSASVECSVSRVGG